MFFGEKEMNRSEIQKYIKKVRASKKKQVKLSLQDVLFSASRSYRAKHKV